ncbi:mRNA cleavage and polyadenylation factor CLP1 P-loop domain-containing protein [Giardia duodenalis]|uniref:mRNA cleavage and polyadenylation factor CLP1 P-loop domain-containing protein n=1 Tax=Giardia intestinalis (strain ATCC 50803 / WB clone C6) TaxID=184922 RepID=D3KHH4_GIAIC|nr:mRNA cleavage and polyadenylation factor CLP1 P-loop domain-containing protein [Giardia intestinalis]KAE8301594.1 mRNA cleavage and polyadenylation factor CLP1 P-loop domain-containing protein [Giardia intestinalis]
MKILPHDDLFSVVTLYRDEVCAVTGSAVIYLLRGKALINGAPIIAPRTLLCSQIYGHVTIVSSLPAAYYGHVREAEKELNKLHRLLGEHPALLIERFAERCIGLTEDSPVAAIFVCVPLQAELSIVYRTAAKLDGFNLYGVSLDEISHSKKAFGTLSSSVKVALEWHVACKSISAPKSILVVGPQGVGKSVFSRLLANFKTGYHRYVVFVDADCRNGESICPSVLRASVLQSGQRSGSDFPLMGSVFTYCAPYGYTSVSSDPDSFVELVQALLRICTAHLYTLEASNEDVPTIICMPVWFQGTMDTIIERCVMQLGCDGIVEMCTDTSIQILAPTDCTLFLTSWEDTKRRSRENALTFPGLYHYVVQGLQGLPGMDHFRTLRFLQSIIDFKKIGITPSGSGALCCRMTGRDLLCSAPFVELVSQARPLQYLRIVDLATLRANEPHYSTSELLYKTTYPVMELSVHLSDDGVPGTIFLSQSLHNIVNKLPESRVSWALRTIFSAMPVYLYSTKVPVTSVGSVNILRFVGIGLLRNFNGLNPCIVSTLSSADMGAVSAMCLPYGSSFIFSPKLLRGNLEGFTTNQSMSKVVGHETYGGKGPNLLATERC